MYKSKSVGDTVRIYAISFAMAILTVILLSLISTLILTCTDNPTANIGIFSLVVMLISSFISGFATAKIYEEGGLSFCALVALGVVLLMLLSGVIFTKGQVGGGAFMNYGCYFGVFMISSFIAVRMPKRRKRHR